MSIMTVIQRKGEFMKILTFLWGKIEEILKSSFFLIFGITFFNFATYGINRYFWGKYLYSPFFTKISKFLFSFFDFFMLIIGLVFILSFLNKKISNYILKIFFSISFFLFIIESFLLINFKSLINVSIIQILLETNKTEAVEFFEMYFNLRILILLIVILAVYSVIKFINSKIKFNIFKSNIFKFIFIIYPLVKIFSLNSDIDIFNVTRFYKSVKMSYQNIKEYNEIFSNLEKNSNTNIISNNSKIKNIVFVIGESTARNHMSLYGYFLKTNPLLEKLEKEGGLYKFTDTISPHSHTIPVIKKLLTFYNYESTEEWYTYNNIIDIMKNAGYKTYWFSNQESSGIYGNVAVALGKKSDVVIFNKVKDSSQDFNSLYDEQILDKSLKYIDRNSEKNFIIYHLMGTHSVYKNRYPQEFEIFKNENSKISNYDNAVLYNDYVIDKIISTFKDEETIIVYVSDHGEEVYDFRNFAGHAEDNGSRYMIEIPFLIYISDKFKINYPETVKKIEDSVDKPYMTDDLIHTILDIAEIKTSEYEKSRSIINNKFNSLRKRIFYEKDYETYWKNRD